MRCDWIRKTKIDDLRGRDENRAQWGTDSHSVAQSSAFLLRNLRFGVLRRVLNPEVNASRKKTERRAGERNAEIAIDLVALYKSLGGGWQSTENQGPKSKEYAKPPMPAAQIVTR